MDVVRVPHTMGENRGAIRTGLPVKRHGYVDGLNAWLYIDRVVADKSFGLKLGIN